MLCVEQVVSYSNSMVPPRINGIGAIVLHQWVTEDMELSNFIKPEFRTSLPFESKFAKSVQENIFHSYWLQKGTGAGCQQQPRKERMIINIRLVLTFLMNFRVVARQSITGSLHIDQYVGNIA